MPSDVWTPMITTDHSLRNKSMRRRNKVAHVELLLRYAVTVKISCPPEKKSKVKNNDNVRKVVISDKIQEKKRISVLRKKEQSKNKKNNDDFQKVVIYNKMYKIKIIFCFPGEKSKSQKQTKNNDNDFRNVVIYD